MAEIYSTGKQSVDALIGGLRFEQDNNRIIGRDENNIPRMLILASGTDFSMKVSAPGKDVLTCTLEELIFNSDQNLFKIVSTGTVTLPTYSVTSAAGAWRISSVAVPPSATIAHGQGRIPVIFAFVKVTGPGGPALMTLPYTDFGIISGSAYFHTINLAVDATNILINESTLTNGSVGTLTHGGLNIEYYILQQTAA